MRPILLVLHRWAGLTIALAVVVTGLTGAVLPFQKELREWIAPEVWHVEPPGSRAQPLSGLQLKAIVEQKTGGTVSYVQLVADPARAMSIFVSARSGQPTLPYQQVFVDPYTGSIRARVSFADLTDGRVNWIPFLIQFHYSLAAGQWGRLLLGIAALMWAGMSLVGLVLAMPHTGKDVITKARRLRYAFFIRRGRGSRIFAHDLHRASGLWLWPAMLVFAWSAVAFNLDSVHQPVQRLFGAEGLFVPVANAHPAMGAALTPEQALATGERLMAAAARQQNFQILRPEAISWNDRSNAIGYYALTTLDAGAGRGSTVVWFDQVSGKQLAFRNPFGNTAADGFDKTLRLLHTGEILGWPWRIFICLFGLTTAAMAIAGCILWVRKGRKRRGSEPQLWVAG